MSEDGHSPLWYALIQAVQTDLPEVTVHESPNGNYWTVKHQGKHTLGYINGKKVLRIDFPTRDGIQKQMHVKRPVQVGVAVRRFASYLPSS